MKKMWTLLKKDIWTSFTDKTILLMVLTPAILALIFRVVYFDPWMLLLTMALFNIVLVPLTDYPLLLVEEKERDTLSLLSRSGVSLAHFALSKAGACLVVGELMAVVVFLIAGADMSLLPEYLLVHLAGVTCVREGPEQRKCVRGRQCGGCLCGSGLFLLERGIWKAGRVPAHRHPGRGPEEAAAHGGLYGCVPGLGRGRVRGLVPGRNRFPLCDPEKETFFPHPGGRDASEIRNKKVTFGGQALQVSPLFLLRSSSDRLHLPGK